MPYWYSPNSHPPTAGELGQRYDHHDPNYRACDAATSAELSENDEVDKSNYLDEQWNYSSYTDKENRVNRGVDGLQCRIEGHLANMFPSSASYFSGNDCRLDRNMRPDSRDGGNDNSNDGMGHAVHDCQVQNNGKPTSKAAEFFYPRPVMALMPYRKFFSPLVADVDNEFQNIFKEENDYKEQGYEDRVMLSSSAVDSDDQWSRHHYTHQKGHHYSKDNQSQGSQQGQGFAFSQNKHAGISSTRNQDSSEEWRGNNGFSSSQNHQLSHNRTEGNGIFQMSRQSVNNANQNREGNSQGQQHRQELDHPNKDNCNFKTTIHSAYDGTEHEETVSPHDSGSLDLFEAKDGAKKPPQLHNSSKSPPSAQSKITQNPKTGQLGLHFEKFLAKSSRKKEFKSWDCYNGGGRAASVQTIVDTKEKKKKSETKTEKSTRNEASSKNGGQSEVEKLIDSIDNATKKTKTKKRSSDPIDESVDKVTKRSKQVEHSLEENATQNNIQDTKTKTKSKLVIAIEDFKGLEEMNIRNAAACMEGLKEFLRLIGQQRHVTWTMLFLDKYYAPKVSNGKAGKGKSKKKGSDYRKSGKFDLPEECSGYQISTAFFPNSKKYCTEKGPPCSNWNCKCDRQIRAKRATAPLLGAMFLFKNDTVDEESENSFDCFILPLGKTTEISFYKRMVHWPLIPFECDVSLHDRWDAFKAILSSTTTKLVTYNATVSLLPLYHHLLHDDAGRSKKQVFSEFMTCLYDPPSPQNGERNRLFQPLTRDQCLFSIWDLRLVSWMLRPGVTDEQIEYSYFRDGFAHLAPNLLDSNDERLAVLSRGLLETKNNLLLLNNIYPMMDRQLISNDLLPALEQIEAPVQSILAAMECRGIGFRPQRLQKFQSEIQEKVEKLEVQGRQITKNADFLLSSAKQVSHFLFDVLKLSLPADFVTKTKPGSNHRSTSEEALQAIKKEMIKRDGKVHPIISIILEFRGLNKLLTTYILPLPKFCFQHEFSTDDVPRIHPQWMQTAVRTGRLSCRQPNLQQVPKSKEAMQGVDPRRAFVASKKNNERILFACDYSQKEVRILAHMSGDRTLMSLFQGDKKIDIYKQMTSIIRNKPTQTVTTEERAQFKQVTLAILYGMSPKQVAKKLDISDSAAIQMMKDFFGKFSGLKKWMDETKEYARQNKYVKTIAGRRRYLDAVSSDDRALRAQAERQAINTVIQGSAADLMKNAMINLSENLRQWKGHVDKRPQMLLQIHDELILELHFNEEHIYWLREVALKSCCRDNEKYFGLKVPLILDCSCGFSWQSMRPLGDPK